MEIDTRQSTLVTGFFRHYTRQLYRFDLAFGIPGSLPVGKRAFLGSSSMTTAVLLPATSSEPGCLGLLP